MVSKEIEQFAITIDQSITDAITVAKNDYKNRLESAQKVLNFDDLFAVQGVSRAEFAKGYEGEMRRVQKEQNSAIETQIQKADDQLSSMMGNPSKTDDIIFLTEKLDGWVKRVEEIAIPKGPYTGSYSASPTDAMVNIQKKWKDFCENDPSIQKAALYEQKIKLEEEIKSLTDNIVSLEKELPDLQAEYDDRIGNNEKYKNAVQEDIKNEIEAISAELCHLQEAIRDLENQETGIQTQLASLGRLAFGKKKELKAQQDKIANNITTAKNKISELEKEIQSIKNSGPERVAALGDKITQLKSEIESKEKELVNSKSALTVKQGELAEIKAKL